ncbi:hypothetical protein C7S18_04050 [Ahniella affigens]|uniref:Ferritin-like domain-containing protein n=1 Tax=Ahniella affigens TaxID=2021234 RepID=A0A2P1PNL4_9GAMM|nr:ferritin-like domain-containing protein [Ahniella affigens]AVP96416.1 hypothetical protein C7S18_04050 [Ahniella affigens]
MFLIDRIKHQLHQDIVADPVLHARVLNLYLCGEAYPHAVNDYFPVAAVRDPDLAEAMRQHQADEDKHIALYAKAIQKLGEPVQQLPPEHIFNHVIRQHSAETWHVEPEMADDQRTRRVASFLAHAHILEKRVARSLEYHLEACNRAADPYPAKAVAAVLGDEQRHVSYTHDAVFHLLPRAEAAALLRSHERAEARANLDFSSNQLRRLLREETQHWPTARRGFYRACAAVMRGVLHCA